MSIVENNSNGSTIIKIIAALMVIISHSFVLYGLRIEPILHDQTLGSVAVAVFFVISGYLISMSWGGNPDRIIFIKKRAFRIYPALIASVLISAFIIAPVAAKDNFNDFFKNTDLWLFVFSNILAMAKHETISGVFEQNPFQKSINGSLWSLRYEIIIYAVFILSTYIQIARQRKWIYLSIYLIFFLLSLALAPSKEIIIETSIVDVSMNNLCQLSCFFWGGAFIQSLKNINPTQNKLAILLFFTLLLLLIIFQNKKYPTTSILLMLLPISTCFLIKKIRICKDYCKNYDISYGLYIYSFPIQQLFAQPSWAPGSWPKYFLITTAITIFVAWLSWSLIEKPFLKIAGGRHHKKLTTSQ